jgi:hypothetical protein
VGEEIGEVAGVGGVEEGGEGWREFGGHEDKVIVGGWRRDGEVNRSMGGLV